MIDALLDAVIDPWPPFTFLLPTGHSQSGRRSFDSKLISLLPLDEVPVHVHRFAARVPCDSQGSECQCGIHTAEAASEFDAGIDPWPPFTFCCPQAIVDQDAGVSIPN